MKEKKILNDYYTVKENGEIWNKFGKKLKTWYDYKNDYEKIVLWDNKRRKHYYVHRIVAQAFIPNLENKPCVNHKDSNKKNNQASNLEWVTYSENHKHAYKNGFMHSDGVRKGVWGVWSDGTKKHFKSISLACKYTGVSRGTISKSANGLNTAKTKIKFEFSGL